MRHYDTGLRDKRRVWAFCGLDGSPFLNVYKLCVMDKTGPYGGIAPVCAWGHGWWSFREALVQMMHDIFGKGLCPAHLGTGTVSEAMHYMLVGRFQPRDSFIKLRKILR